MFATTAKRSLDGRFVYDKCGDASTCIAHEAGVWQLKLVSNLGKNISRALVAGGRALESCGSLPWTVRFSIGVWGKRC